MPITGIALIMPYFAPQPSLGKSMSVTGFVTVSTTDTSFPSVTRAVTSIDAPVLTWIVLERWALLTSTASAKLLAKELEDSLASFVFRKRHTTAQSSILEVGNRVRQAR
jgi:hypothetical protein